MAKSRLSLTVRLLNSRDCWNSREMPRLEIFSGGRLVISTNSCFSALCFCVF
ncbi:hypothetical protein KJ878_00305 [Patescibacteria group bacterium]|nr:hypothetical protein [Patescibacteria group bacterium]